MIQVQTAPRKRVLIFSQTNSLPLCVPSPKLVQKHWPHIEDSFMSDEFTSQRLAVQQLISIDLR